VAKISVTFNISQSNREMTRRASLAINRAMAKAAQKSRRHIEKSLVTIITQAIMSSDVYQRILNGDLKTELGIPNGDDKFAAIINQWVKNIKVKAVPNKTNPLLLLDIGAIDSSYSDVLALPEAEQENVNRGGRPTARRLAGLAPDFLPWLRWLLVEGGAYIVDFDVATIPGWVGRAGTPIMVEDTRRFWTLPPGVGGTYSDNFVIDALNSKASEIRQILHQNFVAGIK
jgi:hypothetical protein